MSPVELNQTLCFNAQQLLSQIERVGWRRGATHYSAEQPRCLIQHINLFLPAGQGADLVIALKIVIRERFGYYGSLIGWNDWWCRDQEQAMDVVRAICEPRRPREEGTGGV